MKNLSFLLLLTLPFFSCKKENLSLFTIPIVNLNVPISAGLDPNETHFFTIKNVPTNSLALFAARGVDTASIKQIVPRRAQLSAIFGEADLDFMREVEVRICPRGQSDDDYCGKEVFYQDQVPNNVGADLDLFGSNIGDVKELLLADKVDVRVIIRRFWSNPPSFDMKLDLEFDVQ